jgi:hypothetical protein
MKDGKLKKCRFLVKLAKNTVCRVYRDRLGRKIDEVDGMNMRCNHRINALNDYEGCPYNTGKPMFKAE